VRPEELGIGKLFERVRDAVIVADAETQRIVLWNPAATKTFGYSIPEALERRLEELIPEPLKARHRAGMARYAKTGRGLYIDSHRLLDLPALRNDGQEIRIELSLSPIGLVDDTDGGGARFVLAIVRDVTEREQAEEEIRRLNGTLEGLKNLVGKLVAAQEEERRRVAYEVHEGLAQVAVAAHLHLQAFSSRYPPGTEGGRGDLERAMELIRKTVADARRITANLRPTGIDDFGLASAISLEVERLRKDGYGVDYEEGLGGERLPSTVEIALFRVAWEALQNIRAHARTRRVRIELRRERDEVCLEVRNYGRGLNPYAASSGDELDERGGLAGMREQVALLGGELRIVSKRSAGTSLVVEVPLPARGSS